MLRFARALRLDPFTPGGHAFGPCGALFSALLLGLVGEWLFHRCVMHRPPFVRLLHASDDLHHRGHHRVHFRPDTNANTNFLLPFGDVLFGTFRLTATEGERRRWPTFEEARTRLVQPT